MEVKGNSWRIIRVKAKTLRASKLPCSLRE